MGEQNKRSEARNRTAAKLLIQGLYNIALVTIPLPIFIAFVSSYNLSFHCGLPTQTLISILYVASDDLEFICEMQGFIKWSSITNFVVCVACSNDYVCCITINVLVEFLI